LSVLSSRSFAADLICSSNEIHFIKSQKKNAQLVFGGYIFNKKLTQANGQTTWRCAEVIKHKCRALCITRNNVLIRARREHSHPNHAKRIGNRTLFTFIDEVEDCSSSQAETGVLLEPDSVVEALTKCDGALEAGGTTYSIVQQAFSYKVKLCVADDQDPQDVHEIYL
jgi:FLYWCH zinc finger domain